VTVRNTGTTRHTLLHARLRHDREDVFECSLTETHVVLDKQRGAIQITVSCQPREPGVSRSVLWLQFMGFVIGRFLEVHCGDSEVNELLQANAPYKRRGKVKDMFKDAVSNTVKAERPVLPLSKMGLTLQVLVVYSYVPVCVRVCECVY
jgi:hypothetical protein